MIVPLRDRAAREMMTRREAASPTGVSHRLVPSASRIASAFDAPNAATTTSAGIGENRERQREAPRRRLRRVVHGDDGVRLRVAGFRLRAVRFGGQAGKYRRDVAVLADADERQIEERRIAGNRPQLVGRAPSGLLELGQLAVHPVNARGRHARRRRATASMRGHSSNRDGQAEPRARRSRTGRCAPNRHASAARTGRNADATDPPGSATMNLSRLAITSAACAVNSLANVR